MDLLRLFCNTGGKVHCFTYSYAVVKKEPPPRPPAPVRRKRSTRSLGDRQFFTMPLRKNQIDVAPERPVRNYSTIGPTRPARRVSLTSLEKYAMSIFNNSFG